jgi:hypothetical protein
MSYERKGNVRESVNEKGLCILIGHYVSNLLTDRSYFLILL